MPMAEEAKEQPEEQVETPEVTEDEALENSKNPERTKEYIDKLKKEKDEAKKEYKNVLESLRPDYQPQPQQEQPQQPQPQAPSASQYETLEQKDVDDVFKSMMDDKGYIDGNKLLQTLKDMDERNRKAHEENEKLREEVKQVKQNVAQTEAQTRQQQDKILMDRVHQEFPQIDPESDEFDEAFYTDVRNELLSQLINGKQDPMEAANAVYNRSYKDRDVNKKQKEELKEQNNKKAQINAVGTKSTVTNDYWKDHEEKALREGARAGTKGSVAELLRRRGQ